MLASLLLANPILGLLLYCSTFKFVSNLLAWPFMHMRLGTLRRHVFLATLFLACPYLPSSSSAHESDDQAVQTLPCLCQVPTRLLQQFVRHLLIATDALSFLVHCSPPCHGKAFTSLLYQLFIESQEALSHCS